MKKCRICKVRYKNSHTCKPRSDPPSDRPLVCKKCGKHFKSERAFILHIKLHDIEKYECPQCHALCFNPEDWYSHKLKHAKQSDTGEGTSDMGCKTVSLEQELESHRVTSKPHIVADDKIYPGREASTYASCVPVKEPFNVSGATGYQELNKDVKKDYGGQHSGQLIECKVHTCPESEATGTGKGAKEYTEFGREVFGGLLGMHRSEEKNPFRQLIYEGFITSLHLQSTPQRPESEAVSRGGAGGESTMGDVVILASRETNPSGQSVSRQNSDGCAGGSQGDSSAEDIIILESRETNTPERTGDAPEDSPGEDVIILESRETTTPGQRVNGQNSDNDPMASNTQNGSERRKTGTPGPEQSVTRKNSSDGPSRPNSRNGHVGSRASSIEVLEHSPTSKVQDESSDEDVVILDCSKATAPGQNVSRENSVDGPSRCKSHSGSVGNGASSEEIHDQPTTSNEVNTRKRKREVSSPHFLPGEPTTKGRNVNRTVDIIQDQHDAFKGNHLEDSATRQGDQDRSSMRQVVNSLVHDVMENWSAWKRCGEDSGHGGTVGQRHVAGTSDQSGVRGQGDRRNPSEQGDNPEGSDKAHEAIFPRLPNPTSDDPENKSSRKQQLVGASKLMDKPNNSQVSAEEYKCTYCRKSFFNVEDKDSHEKEHLSCKICNAGFDNPVELLEHYKHCSISGFFKCHICYNLFSSKTVYEEHLQKHSIS